MTSSLRIKMLYLFAFLAGWGAHGAIIEGKGAALSGPAGALIAAPVAVVEQLSAAALSLAASAVAAVRWLLGLAEMLLHMA